MSKAKCLPNALVIGAPKSGTTSLFHYLRQHADVFLPVQKELHYFSYDLLQQNTNGPGDRDALSRACATMEEYEAHFGSAETEKVIAEVSPSYFYYCQVSERIRSELGAVKIIALLRDPVRKAFSQYMHLVRRNRETLGFYEALAVEAQRREAGWSDMWRYAESSLYAERVKSYISVFGESNVKIVLTEDLARAPDEFIHGIFEFLEVDTDFHPDTSKFYNKSGLPRSKLVDTFLSKPGSLRAIVRQFVPNPYRSRIKGALLDLNRTKSELDEKSKAYLVSYFHSDITETEAIIGRRTDWTDG